MASSDDPFEVGYGNPPQHTQFVKGQSGNPKGRPKGSQNLATILAKTGRQRIKVTENGRTRYISKFEASMLQLLNKAASGDLKAIGELLGWLKSFADSEQASLTLPVPHESDKAVIANVLERIRQSEDPPSDNQANPVADGPSPKEE